MQEPISFPRRHFLAAGLGAVLLAAGRGFGAACAPTDENPQGPFYLPDMPFRPDLAPRDEPGERLTVTGRVLSAADCRPLTGAVVEVWHASAGGVYYGMEGDGGDDGRRLRGRARTGADGAYRFETVLPGRYPLSPRRFRPRHIHYLVSHPGHRTLVTQLFANGKLWLALAGVVGLQVVAVHWGPAQAVFDTVDLCVNDWLLAAAIASSTLLLEEARKSLVALFGGKRR